MKLLLTLASKLLVKQKYYKSSCAKMSSENPKQPEEPKAGPPEVPPRKKKACTCCADAGASERQVLGGPFLLEPIVQMDPCGTRAVKAVPCKREDDPCRFMPVEPPPAPPKQVALIEEEVCDDQPPKLVVCGPQKPPVEICTCKGSSLAVLTSGGDSQGMNACIRAVIRMGINMGAKTYFIREGYSGLVRGGNSIVRAFWVSVSSIIHLGGTTIGSSRCEEFCTRCGRLKAAYNLVRRGINNLVVIGGDGSLTGASIFHSEWQSLLAELVELGKITEDECNAAGSLQVVGVVASIDNDFCGTDLTIGCDSALHRIIEAVDSIVSTATSHQRTFILEVMGRHCGYLAIVSSIISEADYLFFPESPPPHDWHERLCTRLRQERKQGKRLNIIIIAEGATDREGCPITAQDVKQVILNNLKHDSRITVLGHVQRGGNPSVIDRQLGCRQGAEAAKVVLESNSEDAPVVIGINGNMIVHLDMKEYTNRTKQVFEAMLNRNFELAMSLRSPDFSRCMRINKILSQLRPLQKDGDERPPLCPCKREIYKLAVMHIGDPACGMNAAVHSFVRNCINLGYTIYGISNGIDGLLAGCIRKMTWSDVTGWVGVGGANLGTRTTLPEGNYERIACRFREYEVDGLLIIGGFEAFLAGLQLYNQRCRLREFCIPIAVIPATISNNVPGTEQTIGSDTCLNVIIMMCDILRQSSQCIQERVFVVETFGQYCGYLATVAGLTSAADVAYIFEEEFTIKDMLKDIHNMAAKMALGVKRGMVMRNENANPNYTMDFIVRLYAGEGKDWFSVRGNALGHVQQGGLPSPCDRKMGIIMATKCFKWFTETLKGSGTIGGPTHEDKSSAILFGIQGNAYKYTPLHDLCPKTDFEHKLPLEQWWLTLRPLLKILAKNMEAQKKEAPALSPTTDIKCSVN